MKLRLFFFVNVVIVHCPSATRVVGLVVGAESNKCLEEGQKVLGETMHMSLPTVYRFEPTIS